MFLVFQGVFQKPLDELIKDEGVLFFRLREWLGTFYQTQKKQGT